MQLFKRILQVDVLTDSDVLSISRSLETRFLKLSDSMQ